jgi:hypothetical protein
MEKADDAQACDKANQARDRDEAPVVLDCEAGENPEHALPASGDGMELWSSSFFFNV